MKTLNKFLSLLVITLMVVPMSLVPSVANAVGPTTIFSDGFEVGNFSNWTSSDNDWSVTSGSGHSGSKKAQVSNQGDNDDILLKSISTSGYQDISLSFHYKTGQPLESTDHIYVEWWNGSSWQLIKDLKSLNNGSWTATSSLLSSGASDLSDFKLRFRAHGLEPSTGGGDKDEFQLDDVSLTGTPIPENTLSLCSDGLDNDKDGKIDLEDTDCASFMPKLTVTKIVTNDSGGAKQVSDFSLFVDGNSVTSGAQNTFSTGSHTVSETSDPSYTGTIGGDCASNGTITLSVGDVKSCTITNNDLTDVCPNIAGAQATVPEGKQIVEGQCVDIPPQCNTDVSLNVVSDSSTQVDSHDAVPLTFIHPAWTASIPGAIWIWATDPVESPTNDADLTKVFTKTFTISGAPTSGTLLIATDNSYSVKINGNSVPVVFDQDNFKAETQDSYDVSSMLVTGSNTIEITVTNWEVGQDGNPANNPAGLLYKLEIKSNECPPAPTTATISATKIVCDSESDLPNWGNGGPDITSGTATDYVAQHPTCHITPWTFEWAPNGTANPGDNTGLAGGAWTSFTSTATIPAGTLAWVRENYDNDYVPFSSDVSSDGGWDSTSAEMYCNTDVLNYDNYDWIDPVVAGQTYYCIAFNAKKEVPPPSTSSVKMCKYDDKQQPLSGWTLMLKGTQVQNDLSVPSNTSSGVSSNSLTSGKSYIAESTGTWLNQGGANPVDTEYSTTDAWATHMDGYTGYQTDILELQINSAFDPNSNWGAYNSAHKYAQSFVPSTTGPANFRIFDGTGTTQNEGWFGDNSGNLNVDIYEGYAGVTGEDGCVTFSNVPYGSYNVDEILKDKWSNVSGLGEVTVNDPTEQFNVVNHDDSVPPAPVCDPNIDLIKNGSFENNIVSNPEKWNIFASGTTGLDWLVEWFGGSSSYQDATRPETANIELHNGVNGWLSSLGSQHAELDSDWFGPTNPLNGEPASVAISQDTATVPGLHYELKFDFSPRPDTIGSENMLEVLHNGVLFGASIGPMAGSSNTDWHPHALHFTATSTNTRITFRDAGTPNDSLGTFLDNVSLRCYIPQENGDDDSEITETDVCPNIEGNQSVVPEGKELVNGQCVDKTTDGGEEESNNEQPQSPQVASAPNPPAGNGPVNFGFVAPGNGMVLGASTSRGEVLGDSCTPYLTTYMRMGKKNDTGEVKKLQTFLNEYLGLNIPVTGYFGALTRNAVNQFQIQEGIEVLGPWVKAGLHNSDKEPTGYVYKTTQRRINLIKCNSLDIPVPQLP